MRSNSPLHRTTSDDVPSASVGEASAAPDRLADNLLRGAQAIANKLGWPIRSVYHGLNTDVISAKKATCRWPVGGDFGRILSAMTRHDPQESREDRPGSKRERASRKIGERDLKAGRFRRPHRRQERQKISPQQASGAQSGCPSLARANEGIWEIRTRVADPSDRSGDAGVT